ncbi:MAG: hypothetical protein DRR42_19500 [Gammaproteobacteria bacterium]|nr:MAG: hypothetical protein DRR42_19500 [Gammaproteobacteria bacterium]
MGKISAANKAINADVKKLRRSYLAMQLFAPGYGRRYIYMPKDQRKCPNCDSKLSLVNSSPSVRYARTFFFRFASASIWLLVLYAIAMLGKWALGPLYGIVLYIIGFIVLVVLVKKRFFKPPIVVSTYKCEGCSRYYAYNESIVIDP